MQGRRSWWRRPWAPRPSWSSPWCASGARSEVERDRPGNEQRVDAGVGIVDPGARDVREPQPQARCVAELAGNVQLQDELEGSAQLLAVSPGISAGACQGRDHPAGRRDEIQIDAAVAVQPAIEVAEEAYCRTEPVPFASPLVLGAGLEAGLVVLDVDVRVVAVEGIERAETDERAAGPGAFDVASAEVIAIAGAATRALRREGRTEGREGGGERRSAQGRHP